MDYFETYLLGKAVEACRLAGRYLDVEPCEDGYLVAAALPGGPLASEPEFFRGAPTLEAALAALLADLGVDVEPRPSAEEVRGAREALVFTTTEDDTDELWASADIRDLYATRPLLALAVIAGGEG